jgi:hypothetical protein
MADLPAWITRRADGAILIDPDLAYPAILGLLGVKEDDYDQYWIECAYQCAKLYAQDVWRRLEPDGAVPCQILIISTGGRKERWSLTALPRGRGPEPASQGREARQHYARIRHRLGE